jgi:3-oxoacyl-[acyl-carrier protein] reductase
MPVPLSLSNKVALVTGGSRGIGAATVRLFVQAGARVMFNYQRAQAQADALVKELGEQAAAVSCDLSGLESARTLVEETVHRFGRLDILVANHGIWPPNDAPVDRLTDTQWQKTIAVNLDSVFSLVRYSVARMKKQHQLDPQPSHIVLVSSTAGQRGEAFHADYAATKGALISMVKGLSTELAPDQIYINCVAPGWVDTEMSQPALNDPTTRDAILAKIPIGRAASAEEIAGPILFLCTPLAGFITGEIFNVNGGAVLVG